MRRIGLYVDSSRADSARHALLLVSQALEVGDLLVVQTVLRGLHVGAPVTEVLQALDDLVTMEGGEQS